MMWSDFWKGNYECWIENNCENAGVESKKDTEANTIPGMDNRAIIREWWKRADDVLGAVCWCVCAYVFK